MSYSPDPDSDFHNQQHETLVARLVEWRSNGATQLGSQLLVAFEADNGAIDHGPVLVSALLTSLRGHYSYIRKANRVGYAWITIRDFEATDRLMLEMYEAWLANPMEL